MLWRWEDNFLRVFDAESKNWEQCSYDKGKAADGYNKNIIEEMYIEEMKSFVDAVKGEKKFPNSLEDDINVLKLLNKVEGKIQ